MVVPCSPVFIAKNMNEIYIIHIKFVVLCIHVYVCVNSFDASLAL